VLILVCNIIAYLLLGTVYIRHSRSRYFWFRWIQNNL